jgi:hypothetical protein
LCGSKNHFSKIFSRTSKGQKSSVDVLTFVSYVTTSFSFTISGFENNYKVREKKQDVGNMFVPVEKKNVPLHLKQSKYAIFVVGKSL